MLGRNRGGVAVVAVFCLLQLVPRLLSSDPALTGEGRLFALHMFDGRIECQPSLTLEHSDGRREPWPMMRMLDVRAACDPIVFWNHARNSCRARTDAGDDFELTVLARHASAPAGSERPLIAVDHFCRVDPAYHVLRHNDWIRHN